MSAFADAIREGIEDQGAEINTHSEDGYDIVGVISFEELALHLARFLKRLS